MLELNSCSPVDDTIADISDGEVAGGMDLMKACRSCYDHVPTRPRTHRVVVGILTAGPQDDVYYLNSTKMIVDENKLSTDDKDKHNLCGTRMISYGKNLGAEDDADNLCGPRMIVDGENLSTKDSGDNLCGTQMMVDENNSRKCRKRSRDENYTISADDGWEEESSKKNRRKNVEKRKVAFQKNRIQLQNYPPSEFSQNLRDYISRLNLEAPPLFIAQKVLYPSDIRRGQNRLSLPAKIINTDFFDKCVNDTENKKLEKKGRVEVSLVDNKMHEYHTMNLAKWEMNSSSNYVLITAWNNVVQDNKLEEAVLQKDGKEEAIVVMKDDDKVKSDVVVQVFSGHRELLDSGLCDVVVVSSPNMTHCEILMDIISHPKPLQVLVEKPLCTTITDFQKVVEASKKRPDNEKDVQTIYLQEWLSVQQDRRNLYTTVAEKSTVT